VAEQPEPEPLNELDRQVQHGTLFLHAALTEHASRTNQIEAVVNGLADLLVRLELVATDDLVESVETTRKAIAGAGKQLSLGVAIRGDGESVTIPADEIDCEARIPYCKAVCCRLRFPLTVSEIETGPVKWDLGRPYFNRQAPNGYCHCFDDSSHGCTVYDERPAPCRQYSCKGDERIWKDFEGMVINQEWIDAHLGAERSPIEIFMETAESA
jgi:Fe-S-cluster containining protein